MLKMARKSIAAAIASAVVAASALPAQSMPISMNPTGVASSNIEQVDGRGCDRNRHQAYNGGRYNHNYGNRGGYYNGNRHHGGNHYNGGPRPPRPGPNWGWDDNNDAWVPLAILGAGALIIGGAIAAGNNNRPQQTNGVNPRHYAWCDNRYRSYRSYDNTFQPYNGPRQQCLSPYY